MKSFNRQILILISSLLSVAAAYAVPARPGWRTALDSEGAEVRVRLVGDEFSHCFISESGLPLVQRDGLFYLCDADPSGLLMSTGIEYTAHESEAARNFASSFDRYRFESRMSSRTEALKKSKRRSARKLAKLPNREPEAVDGPPFEKGPGLFPNTKFPAYGNQKAIVILVEYKDVKFNLPNPHDYFSRMLSEPGFADYGATGCAEEYFSTNSCGAFTPEFDLYGPVTLSFNRGHYGGNDPYGNDMHPEEMVIEACQALDDTVDFSEYDRNGDGVIDNVFIFFAGKGEASYGPPESVWPHSWNVAEVSENYFDGVLLDSYGCTNEWDRVRPDGVGTFVHEFSHVIGLPDLYATEYTNSFTPGTWSALAYGPYNNDGMTPPMYGAFERYALGWMEPVNIKEAASPKLPPIADNVAMIIRSNSDDEFFLLENRQRTGWDAFIPGHGMLIWHIDYNENIWWENAVNNNPEHQYVDIEEADGRLNESTRDGDSFPGSYYISAFTGYTTPAMRTWSGTRLNYPITNIEENRDGIISFDVLGGAQGIFSLSDDGFTSSTPLPVRVEGGRVIASQGVSLTICDASGRVVASGVGEASLSAPGLYIVYTDGLESAPSKILINP